MKPLSQMTRDELWALDDETIRDYAIKHGLRMFGSFNGRPMSRPIVSIKQDLDLLQRKLQQDNADSRQDR